MNITEAIQNLEILQKKIYAYYRENIKKFIIYRSFEFIKGFI